MKSPHHPLPEDFVAGNYYDKYASSNPIVRWMMNGFMAAFDSFVAKTGVTNVYEIGCGEGHLLSRMAARGLSLRGCDIAPDVVEIAQSRLASEGYDIPLACQPIEDMDPEKNRAELVVCCEVLEHVSDPNAALDILAKMTTAYVLVSVPREPIWRILNMCRGRYLSTLGNTPGHIQHWSKSAFIAFLEQRLEVVDIASPLPWTMVLCRARALK